MSHLPAVFDRLMAVLVGLLAGGAVGIGVIGAFDRGGPWPLTFIGCVGSIVVGVAVGSWYGDRRRR